MRQPMSQFMHQGQQFLLGIQVRPQHDEIAEHPAVHRFWQRRAHQAGTATFDVGLERTNVVEDRGHGATLAASASIMRPWGGGVDQRLYRILHRKIYCNEINLRIRRYELISCKIKWL